MDKKIIFFCLIFLSSLGVITAEGDDYIKNIEIAEYNINIDHQALPIAAYLCMTLKNNGDRKVSNLTLEIGYYGSDGQLILKSTIKNALNDPIPARETRKYKVRLNEDVVNARNEQYPYSQQGEIAEFDIKITKVICR